jgi:hypothetical protein
MKDNRALRAAKPALKFAFQRTSRYPFIVNIVIQVFGNRDGYLLNFYGTRLAAGQIDRQPGGGNEGRSQHEKDEQQKDEVSHGSHTETRLNLIIWL